MFFIPSIAIVKNLNYTQDSVDDWPRMMWHYFYNQDSIDSVCVGSSHVFFGVNPQRLNELSGEKNFNVANISQHMNATYYSLLEADRVYDIKKAYIEMYYYLNTGENGDYSTLAPIKSGWYATDNMSVFSPVRALAIWDMNPVEYLPDANLPFVRFRKYLFDYSHIRSMLIKKEKEDYKNYKYHLVNKEADEVTDYLDGGYCSTSRIYDNGIVYNRLRTSEQMYITEDASKYLEKCIKYCKKNNIELTLFSVPVWMTSIISTENYDAYHNTVKQIADDNEIEFYDFNLCKGEALDILHHEYFYDSDHLNTTGANIFTEVFFNVVNNNIADNEDIFYDSFQEKVSEEEPEVYGLYQYLEKDNKILCIAATGNEDIEYKVSLKLVDENGNIQEQFLLQDFGKNNRIKVSKSDTGICTICWRVVDDISDSHTVEYRF